MKNSSWTGPLADLTGDLVLTANLVYHGDSAVLTVATDNPFPLVSNGRNRSPFVRELTRRYLAADYRACLKLWATRTAALRISATGTARLVTHGSGGVRAPIADLLRPLVFASSLARSALRPFQRTGVAWLLGRHRGILADDMGLGKTLQAIAALQILITRRRIPWGIVIVPNTLVGSWQQEFRKWVPELAVATAVFGAKDREQAWEHTIGRAHVILTTYEQARSQPQALTRSPIPLVIADEAHRLRNWTSDTSDAFREIQADRLWMLTGTPVERDAEDLGTLLTVLDPRKFSPDDSRLPASQLRARARPFVLRRSKIDVLPQLPEATTNKEYLALTPAQRIKYDEVLRSPKGGPGAILSQWQELRQICDYEKKSGASSKLDRILELLEDIQILGEKALVFSYLLAPLDGLEPRLKAHRIPFERIDGSMDRAERENALARFKRDPDAVTLLASSRVASEGLTLTEANHVIFVNRWWNPSANRQAEDRVLRIGQDRPVTIHHLITQNTIEDRLEAILETKSLTFEELILALESGDSGLLSNIA